MNKIFVVVGIKHFTQTEIYHTRTEIVQDIIGIYSTKKHADEIAEQIGRSRESNYFPESIDVEEYELIEGTYYLQDEWKYWGFVWRINKRAKAS